MFLDVTTGSEPRIARRRLALIYFVYLIALCIPAIFLRASLKLALEVWAGFAVVYLVGLVLPLAFELIAALAPRSMLRNRGDGEVQGTFYLIPPTREWLQARGAKLSRFEQYAVVKLADSRVELWAGGLKPFLAGEIHRDELVAAEEVEFDGYGCLRVKLRESELLLMGWGALLSVRNPQPFITRISSFIVGSMRS